MNALKKVIKWELKSEAPLPFKCVWADVSKSN